MLLRFFASSAFEEARLSGTWPTANTPGVVGVFWSLRLVPFDVLVMRSGFLPRALGVLLLAGAPGAMIGAVTSMLPLRVGCISELDEAGENNRVHGWLLVNKKVVWIGMIVGSTIGGCVPSLWHAGLFSMSGVVMSAVGGIAGIWVAYRLGR